MTKASEALLPADVQVYMVGGGVRDALLGLPVHDRDWVVVGATPELMVAHGFTPVGKDFPVFLHPSTHEEYALARTERKSGKGYKGFTVYANANVSLVEDLARRDLTINAMAERGLPDGRLERIDPFDGQNDLRDKCLRHVSDAFVEDPLRVLRTARFAARFSDFHVAAQTQALMQTMVQSGALAELAAERVWQEIARGLMERAPMRLYEVMLSCGAWAALLPELTQGQLGLAAVEIAAAQLAPLPVRFACLVYGARLPASPEKCSADLACSSDRLAAITAIATRLRVPSELHALALLVAAEGSSIAASQEASAEELLQLFERCDALRRPERFGLAVWACCCIGEAARNKGAKAEAPAAAATRPQAQRQNLLEALRVARSVDTGSVASQAAQDGLRGAEVGARIHAVRVAALQSLGTH